MKKGGRGRLTGAQDEDGKDESEETSGEGNHLRVHRGLERCGVG